MTGRKVYSTGRESELRTVAFKDLPPGREPPSRPAAALTVKVIEEGELLPTADPFLFRLRVEVGAHAGWEALTREFQTLSGPGCTLVDIFWLEEGRMQSFDMLWRWKKGAVKFVVTGGRRDGWVGYYRGTP